jgi:hypothetical protein
MYNLMNDNATHDEDHANSNSHEAVSSKPYIRSLIDLMARRMRSMVET